MCLYGVPLSMSLLDFGMGNILTNFHMCGIMLVLKTLCEVNAKNSEFALPG